MNNRDVFISDSIILASFFCRTRRLDNDWTLELLCRQKFLDRKIANWIDRQTNLQSGITNYRFWLLQKVWKFARQTVVCVRPAHRLCNFKIAQTSILHYYSTYCRQMGRKSNCLLVKRLNVKTKWKQFVLWPIGNRSLHVVSVVWRSCMWLVTTQ